jgi:hypothetical protein
MKNLKECTNFVGMGIAALTAVSLLHSQPGPSHAQIAGEPGDSVVCTPEIDARDARDIRYKLWNSNQRVRLGYINVPKGYQIDPERPDAVTFWTEDGYADRYQYHQGNEQAFITISMPIEGDEGGDEEDEWQAVARSGLSPDLPDSNAPENPDEYEIVALQTVSPLRVLERKALKGKLLVHANHVSIIESYDGTLPSGFDPGNPNSLFTTKACFPLTPDEPPPDTPPDTPPDPGPKPDPKGVNLYIPIVATKPQPCQGMEAVVGFDSVFRGQTSAKIPLTPGLPPVYSLGILKQDTELSMRLVRRNRVGGDEQTVGGDNVGTQLFGNRLDVVIDGRRYIWNGHAQWFGINPSRLLGTFEGEVFGFREDGAYGVLPQYLYTMEMGAPDNNYPGVTCSAAVVFNYDPPENARGYVLSGSIAQSRKQLLDNLDDILNRQREEGERLRNLRRPQQ